MIISLSGFRGSGKGTVSKILQEEYGYTEFSISTPLKDIISHLFSWDRELIEGVTIESRSWRKEIDPYWTEKFGFKVTPELMLTKVGTDLFRNHIDEDFWVSVAERKIEELIKTTNNIVIERCSYINELNLIKKYKGFNIFVEREVPSWCYDAYIHNTTKSALPISLQNIHSSEYSLVGHDFDYYISNHKTKEDLNSEVKKMTSFLKRS